MRTFYRPQHDSRLSERWTLKANSIRCDGACFVLKWRGFLFTFWFKCPLSLYFIELSLSKKYYEDFKGNNLVKPQTIWPNPVCCCDDVAYYPTVGSNVIRQRHMWGQAMFPFETFLKSGVSSSKNSIHWLVFKSWIILFVLSRSSWAILQFNLVPQSYPGPPLYTFDRLGQWPLLSAMGPETTIHSGPVCRCAAGCGAVLEWVTDRWVECFKGDQHGTVTVQPHLCTLCGVLLGLSVGDTPSSQPIGIVLTVVGVVVLDFSADASEGPIRAYLLDVADTDEQDMALNIHAFSAGKTTCINGHTQGPHWPV